ncbi:hypothetical protein ACLESO_11985, partial [Pyxidicoccus sp. 3LG]
FVGFLSRGACDAGRALLPPPALLTHSLSALAATLRSWRALSWRKHHGLARPGLPPSLPA